ncbi:protein of unknown function [Paraburkholderia kururiensis]
MPQSVRQRRLASRPIPDFPARRNLALDCEATSVARAINGLSTFQATMSNACDFTHSYVISHRELPGAHNIWRPDGRSELKPDHPLCADVSGHCPRRILLNEVKT